MEENDLKKLFKKAAEIANTVPDALQQAAFTRALDVLMEQTNSASGKSTPHLHDNIGRKPGRPTTQEQQAHDENSDPIARLLLSMDRTSYPQILNSPRVLERSLALLRAARDDFNTDGLGCAAIAKILTEKFRLRATRQAVQQALDPAGDKVDRVTSSKGKIHYRIMLPGERYLDSPESMDHSKKVNKRRGAKAKPKTQDTNQHKEPKSAKPKPASPQKGLKSILLKLVGEGYFNEPKRIGVVREHLQHKKGYNIKITTLSPYFTRMLRDNILDRTSASDGQYEYKRK